jgi:hypothetical protein
MAVITIVPAGRRDQAIHKKQFAALVSEPDALGHEAVVDIGVETRAITGDVVVYVALKLAERVTDDVLDTITDRVKATLRNLRRPASGERRHAVIFAPDDEIVADIELEDDDEQSRGSGESAG